MPTMIVLVNLKDGVAPEEYETWLHERYVPAVLELPSWTSGAATGWAVSPERVAMRLTSTSSRSRSTTWNSSAGI